MKRRALLSALTATAAASAAAPSHKLKLDGKDTDIVKWPTSPGWLDYIEHSFAMAYYLGPPEERDKRPHGKGQPEQISETPILRSESAGALDIAALIARARQRTRVSDKQLASLAEALLDSDVEAPVKDCYEPRHIVICYGEMGDVCGVIEICLSCVSFRIYPGGRMIRSEWYDIIKAARILHELGLPLNDENETIEDYVKRMEEKINKK